MRKRMVKSFLFGFFALATIVGNAQGDTVISKTQVEKSIQRFANILDSQDVKYFGLKSRADLLSLTAGPQFRKYMIGLYDLQKYKPGDDIKKIIREYPSIEVSLVNNMGNIVTSIEFVKKNDTWQATGFGSTPELIEVRNAQDSIKKSDVAMGRLIRVPALHLSFIAVPSAAGMVFISLQTRPDLNFYKSKRMPASEALLSLVPLANKRKDLPD